VGACPGEKNNDFVSTAGVPVVVAVKSLRVLFPPKLKILGTETGVTFCVEPLCRFLFVLG